MSSSERQLEEARRYMNAALELALTKMSEERMVTVQRLMEADDKRKQAEHAARMGHEDKALDLIDDIELLGEDVEHYAPEIGAKLKELALVAREEMKIAGNPPGERDWFRALTAGKGAMTLIAQLNNLDLEERLGNISTNGLGRSIERKFAALTAISERVDPSHPLVVESKHDLEERQRQLAPPPPVISVPLAPDPELQRMEMKHLGSMDFRPR